MLKESIDKEIKIMELDLAALNRGEGLEQPRIEAERTRLYKAIHALKRVQIDFETELERVKMKQTIYEKLNFKEYLENHAARCGFVQSAHIGMNPQQTSASAIKNVVRSVKVHVKGLGPEYLPNSFSCAESYNKYGYVTEVCFLRMADMRFAPIEDCTILK